jgi:hypothetical protein
MKQIKTDASNTSNKLNALAWQQRDQLNSDDAMWQFAMRVIWVTLSIACAVLGTVLLGILLR